MNSASFEGIGYMHDLDLLFILHQLRASYPTRSGAREMSIQGMFTLQVCCEAMTIKGSIYRLTRMRCVGDHTLWLRPMKNDVGLVR